MKKILIIGIFIFSIQAFAKSCPFPATPLNWILRYCSFEVGTDDEIVLLESICYKNAEKDLKESDQCKIKEKYKLKTCEILIKAKKKFKTIESCLLNNEVKPFFAGK